MTFFISYTWLLRCFLVVCFRRAFVEDNLLFYTVLFRMFMSRVGRFDLRAIKDVQMIQRVTKVDILSIRFNSYFGQLLPLQSYIDYALVTSFVTIQQVASHRLKIIHQCLYFNHVCFIFNYRLVSPHCYSIISLKYCILLSIHSLILSSLYSFLCSVVALSLLASLIISFVCSII